MGIFIHLIICGFIQFGISEAGEQCTNWSSGDKYCTNGCCDNWPYESCCDDPVVGAIIGAVIGGILFISLIVCLICVCFQQKGKSGRVIQPGQIQPPVYTAYTTQYPLVSTVYPQHQSQPVYPQHQSQHPQPVYPPQPSCPSQGFQPNERNMYGGHPDVPEGIHSQPPPSGGLPGNHQVV